MVLLQSDPRGEGIALQFGPALESLSLKQQGQQNCRYTTSGQNMTGGGSVCSEDVNHQEHPSACGHMEKGLTCRPFCYSFQKLSGESLVETVPPSFQGTSLELRDSN